MRNLILGLFVAALVSACGSSTSSKPVIPGTSPDNSHADKKKNPGSPVQNPGDVVVVEPPKGPACTGTWRNVQGQNWQTIQLFTDGTCQYDKNTGPVVPRDYCTYVENGTKLTMTAQTAGSLDLDLATDCSTITFKDVVFSKQ